MLTRGLLALFAAFWWLSKGNAVSSVTAATRRDFAMLGNIVGSAYAEYGRGAPLMHRRTGSFRLTASVAVTGMVLTQSVPAAAQDIAPRRSQDGALRQQSGDPPARVGRLAKMSGTVSFHTRDQDQWGPAVLNYPVTSGNSFWAQPSAQVVIEISASRIVMAPATELDIATLDDPTFQGTTPQGEVYLQLRPSGQGENYALQTPRGLVTLGVPGRYDIVAGDTANPTLVTVIEGAAHVDGPGLGLSIGPEQTASITGIDAFQGTIGPAQRGPFLTAVLASERPSGAPPAGVAAMPGLEDLAQHGNWAVSPEYGPVWYPRVIQGWAPYRDGSWAYVEPWGWTWVDSEPWGFAPFHYGRWISIDGRWAWVPGGALGAPAPVYAPALVRFLGVGAATGVSVGIGAALAEHRIGWCPLAPREAFHPWYRASDKYLRQVNFRNVNRVGTMDRSLTIENFVNRGAATVVPASVMTASRPVAPSLQRIDPAQFAQLRPVVAGQQPLRPAPNTLGVTPAVARHLNLPQTATYRRGIAPGPAFRANPAVGPTPDAVPSSAMQFGTAPALRSPLAPGQIAAPPVTRRGAGAGGAVGPHAPPPAAPTPGGIPHTAALTTVPPAATGASPPVVNGLPGQLYRNRGPAVAPNPAQPLSPARVPPPVVTHPSPPELHAPSPVVHTPPAMIHPAPPPQVRAASPPAVPHASPPAQGTQHKSSGEQ